MTCSYCSTIPIDPARGKPMPQTRAFWEKRAMRDQELILEMKEEISGLKAKNNNLQQKIKGKA